MKQFKFRFIYLFALLFLFQIKRKLEISSNALHFLQNNVQIGFNFNGSDELKNILQQIKEPAVLLLNKHALNITLNFLCNLNHFPLALEKVVIFAFDSESHLALTRAFPHVKTLFWNIPALHQRFTASDGRYQLFQYFRSQLCKFLSKHTTSFWMIQADTIWRGNLFELVDKRNLTETNLIFDSEGQHGLLGKMIAGGYFYVNGTEKSERFFKEIGEKLLNYYVTDNNLMGKQCIENFAGNKCGKFPYSKIVNWRWRRPETFNSSDDNLPVLFQFDGGDGSESKLQAMKRLGAAFLDFDTLDPYIPQPLKCYNKPMKNGILTETRYFESTADTQKANLIIQFFHGLFEFLNATVPGLEYLILSKIFPFWAYYLII